MKQDSTGRRKFIQSTASGAAMLALGMQGMSSLISSCSTTKKSNGSTVFATGFAQKPLPYTYQALEPIIDATTMEIHYSKHAAGYASNLKEAASTEGVNMQKSLEELLSNISKYSTKMRNNGGGHYNHELFWQCMRPKTNDNKPKGKLLAAIEKDFSSFAAFKSKFATEGKNRFGSGWAWLYKDANGLLKTGSTANQDNPLMNISSVEPKGTPILCLDVWEHAYYLKYQNKRADYIDNWWSLVNWDFVAARFEAA